MTALTVAISEAAEDLAKASPGGRLPVPIVAVLHEAANVCRWRELPHLYSPLRVARHRAADHPAVLVPGRRGVGARRDAQAVVGREREDLRWRRVRGRVPRRALPTHRRLRPSPPPPSRTAAAAAQATWRHDASGILDVDDLTALPRGRVVVFASGARAALARSIPWMAGPHADAVRASIRAHDPVAEATIASAAEALADVDEADTGLPG